MTVHSTCVTLSVVLGAGAAAGAGAPAVPGPEAPHAEELGPLARVDAGWNERDVPERLAEVTSALEEAAARAPDDFEVLWRQARLDVWRSDDPTLDRKERSKIGKRAWEVAERAVEKDPARVEGHLYAALGMGNYALALGVFRALREGIEGKFRARLGRAEQIDPAYLGGTIYVAWGRFFYELPWPKYDARRSEENLRKALRVNPASVRARVYLAELYEKEGKRDQARNLLSDALAVQPGAYDAPDERRMQARARELLSKLK
jgi:tetratricopeptide (TPR) repeat protein